MCVNAQSDSDDGDNNTTTTNLSYASSSGPAGQHTPIKAYYLLIVNTIKRTIMISASIGSIVSPSFAYGSVGKSSRGSSV